VPAPTKKLKNFFWDKLPDMRLHGSVWEGLGPAEWLDWEQMEDLFAQVVTTCSTLSYTPPPPILAP
jgi:hypothetical protein